MEGVAQPQTEKAGKGETVFAKAKRWVKRVFLPAKEFFFFFGNLSPTSSWRNNSPGTQAKIIMKVIILGEILSLTLFNPRFFFC